MKDLDARMGRLGSELHHLARRLGELGYRFDDPARTLPGPEADAADAIDRIEREAGPLPLALKRFWLEIGSIDLRGSHPDWDGCDLPDPLVVFPPSVAVEEWDEFLADRRERLQANFPYLVPIAPDPYHKAGFSGGMWLNVTTPAVADDPPLNEAWHGTTFLDHIETAISWAGFPGLKDGRGHSWPIAAILSALDSIT